MTRSWSNAVLGCLTAAAGSTAATAQQLPTRVTIDILVVAQDPVAKEQMMQWSNALQSRLSRLHADGSLGISRSISVRPFPQQTFSSASALQTRWQQRRAIQIVLAQGVRIGSKVTAEGDVFLGGLKGDLASPLVPISQPITPESYRKASDYILMTSLYALSIDAGGRKPVACALLRQANLLGRGIAAAIDPAKVKDAVARRLQRTGCRATR